LLTSAAVISLALGLYQTFRTTDSTYSGETTKLKWLKGAVIIGVIIIVIIISALNDWQMER